MMHADAQSVTALMRRADALLEQLIDQPAEQREIHLAALGDEAQALQRTVRSLLLAWDSQSGGELATGAAGTLRVAAPSLDPGTRIGPFAVQRLLGQGGMGQVYLAERVDGQFAQWVAIKRITNHGWVTSERAAYYLTRERSLLARLQHPGIATLIDGGLDDEGHPWLAMEYIDGEPLDAYLRNRQPTLDQRWDLLLQLVAAVTHAHRQLVVHGDLKPANILVQPDGRLRVLDFGIARSLSEEPAANVGSMATPGWASPEQVAGAQPGIASDQHQIGRLAVLILTGSPGPANGHEPLALAALAKQAGAPHARRLDTALDEVLSRCLRSAPEDRYPDLSALMDDLRAWRQHRPIQARAASWRWRALGLVRRHPLSLALAVLLFLLTVVFIAALAQQNQALRLARDRAGVAAEQMRLALDKRGQMLDFMERVFTLADPLGEAGVITDMDALLAAAIDEVQRQFPNDAELRHEARSVLGVIAQRRGMAELAERALAASERDAPPQPQSTAAGWLLILRSDLERDAGKLDSADDHVRDALAIFSGESLTEQRLRRYLLGMRIDLLRSHGRESDARELVPALLELLQRDGVTAYERSAALGMIALVEPEPSRAYALQRQAYEALAEVQDAAQPMMIKRLSNLAGTRMLMRDYHGAAQDYAEAMRLIEQAGGLDSPFHAIAQAVYGKLLASMGQWQAARPWLERALAIQRRESSVGALWVYTQGNWLAWAVETQAPDPLAEQFRAWLDSTVQIFPAQHPRMQDAYLLQVRLWRRQGEFKLALGKLDELGAALRSDDALFESRLAKERVALLLDQDLTGQACLESPVNIADEQHAALFHDDLVSGRALQLDAAICARHLERGSRAAVDLARERLLQIAGPDYWLLQRR